MTLNFVLCLQSHNKQALQVHSDDDEEEESTDYADDESNEEEVPKPQTWQNIAHVLAKANLISYLNANENLNVFDKFSKK